MNEMYANKKKLFVFNEKYVKVCIFCFCQKTNIKMNLARRKYAENRE